MKNNWAKYTDVYVSVDYPPSERYHKGWEAITNFLKTTDFSVFSSFSVIQREKNYGFENNVENLIAILYDKYDRFIVLEDDLELSPNYIEFMDKCLNEFEKEDDIVAVTGYSYPVNWDVSEGATCMKQNYNAAAWGRGFWKSKRLVYSEYISSGQLIKNLDRAVSEKKYKKMIDASLREYIPAAVSPSQLLHKFMYIPCDISMRAYLALSDKYVVSPVISKVRNMGFDGSGVYCQAIDKKDGMTASSYDYSQQPIDSSGSFEIILNTCNNKDNYDLLNEFDYRTTSQMRRTNLYLWMMSHIGVWSAKLIATFLFPFDVSMRVAKKCMNSLRKVGQ